MIPPLNQDHQRPAKKLLLIIRRAFTGIRIDLTRLHSAWMTLGYPHDPSDDYSVVENWLPTSFYRRQAFRLWAVLGGIGLIIAYPLFVVGLATRFYSRRINRLTASLGLIGIGILSVVVWGLFTLVTYLSPITFEGFVAVLIAGLVASVSAVCTGFFTRVAGRGTTVILGYPFGVTAIFLPPVVASLYSRMLASIIFPHSETIAIWLLDNLLHYGGLAAMIRATFDLDGVGHVAMWFGLAFPVGWMLGTLVTFTYLVPRRDTFNSSSDSSPESIAKNS